MKELIGADRRRSTNGFVVVAVLWMLAALATLASVYAIYVSNAVISSRLHDDRIQVQALMSAALDLTAYQFNAVNEESRPTRGVFTFRLGGARVAAEYSSENARIDLNMAPKDLLAGLFVALGASSANAEGFADRVVGWRTASSEESNEAESYRVAGLSYQPRGAPFVHAGELWLVRGLPPQLVERAMPYVTVYSGKAGINPLDAAPLVVAALPGMNAERLRDFLNQRAVSRREGQRAMGLFDAAAQSMTAIEASKAYRVTVRADLENGRQFTGTAVILIPVGEDDPYRVLSWADTTDGSVLYELPATALR